MNKTKHPPMNGEMFILLGLTYYSEESASSKTSRVSKLYKTNTATAKKNFNATIVKLILNSTDDHGKFTGI